MTDACILVVDDELHMRRLLRTALAAQGFKIVEAASAAEARSLASSHNPELLLLDLGLPDGDGVELVRELRSWCRAPIVVLSARGREQDKVDALDAGADDYVTKPFGMAELLARVRVALRRAAQPDDDRSPILDLGPLRIDLGAHVVTRGGTEVHLTRTEFRVLALLTRHADRVVTHRQILREVWGPGAVDHPHYVRVQMAELRRKLEADPARPRWLLTEQGVGYRLRTEHAAASRSHKDS